jgi:hypothetical protein
MEPKQEVWVYDIRYALTTGVHYRKGTMTDDDYFCYIDSMGFRMYIPKRHYTLTEHIALCNVEKMRLKKIASLKKQLKKLEEFEVKIIKSN